jgi:hypothetical protein
VAGGFIPLRLPLNFPNFNPTRLILNCVKLRIDDENTKSYFSADTAGTKVITTACKVLSKI